jgi:predicted NACHT family NTPase
MLLDVLNRRLEQAGQALDYAIGRRVSRYGRRYRRHVYSRQRFIDTKDLAYSGSHTPELDDIFVDLGLVRRSPHEVSSGMLATKSTDVPKSMTIEKYLGHEKSTIMAVIGAPGSGKTTLLRHLARNISHGKRGRRRIPIFLTLRDCVGPIIEKTSPYLPQLMREVTPEMLREPPGWWEYQLDRGNCVVLLDGLDEVARIEDRTAIARWVEEQISTFPDNDFIITSRPHGYRSALISGANVVQVLPFTRAQVRRFIGSWYRSAERLATGFNDSDVDREADEKANDLIRRLDGAPALRDLTVNPLLLTMIALGRVEE